MATQKVIPVTASPIHQPFDAASLTITAPRASSNNAVANKAGWLSDFSDDSPRAPEVPDSFSPPSPEQSTEREIGGRFVLGQNFPEAHHGETTVPFTLFFPASIRLELFDPQGRKVTSTIRRGMSAGRHAIKLNLRGLGLPAGTYSYQMEVSMRFGVYQQAKTMTIL